MAHTIKSDRSPRSNVKDNATKPENTEKKPDAGVIRTYIRVNAKPRNGPYTGIHAMTRQEERLIRRVLRAWRTAYPNLKDAIDITTRAWANGAKMALAAKKNRGAL